ncbi:MAG: membrane protein insertion efficiency factor YidD [Candidatus Kapabacteria bacterium]|nr:membrane protein insertion efficiency factor YidD [Candidatus Kapabacteria bacterium]
MSSLIRTFCIVLSYWLSISFGATVCSAHDSDEPTERKETQTVHSVDTIPPAFTDFLIGGLISSYQSNAKETSVGRCPYATSCSAFGKDVFHRYGMIGLLLFLDRYFFREHNFIGLYYPLKELANGSIRYNDDYFKHLCNTDH